MMISRRPVSSPGRVKPLMGFLRSTSRSKGRSRASPLFVRRNKSAAAVTQEPSSPKVTCMGQVRVNKSKPKPENPTRRKKRCEWMQNAAFYNRIVGKLKTMSFWPKCGFCSFRQKDKSSRRELDCPVIESVEENFSTAKICVSKPPVNAFLLTRSRSAPFRSSSLAFRFWEENNQREMESRNAKSELVRSKSEPARNGEKMVVVASE